MGLADFLGRYQAVLAGVEEALSHLQRAEQLMRQVQTSLNRRVDGIQYALGLKGGLPALDAPPEPSPSSPPADEEVLGMWGEEQTLLHPGAPEGAGSDSEIEVLVDDENEPISV